MRTAARLTFRLYRFELLAILAYGLVLAGLAAVVAVRLASSYPGTDCMRQWQGAPAVPGCESTVTFLDINEAEAGKVMAAMWLLPLVAGVLAGSVLVAREIEHRTTQFAWSVGTSRRRWFLDRVIPVFVVAVGAVVLAAVAAEFVEASRAPWLNPLASAGDFGLRGPIIVALAVAAFGVSVFVGSLVGRMLPALILSAVLVVVMRSAVDGLLPFGEPVGVLGGIDYSSIVTEQPLVTGSAWQEPDGRIRYDYTGPEVTVGGDQAATTGHTVAIGVAGQNLWHVEARESAIFVAIGLGGLLASAVVVQRRRPY
jgi:hypothetical protein